MDSPIISLPASCRFGYYCDYEVKSLVDSDGIKIAYCTKVYEPAEDTWIAYDLIKALYRVKKPVLCIDIGTGSGVLASLCSILGAKMVIATDVNPCATFCAKKTSALSNTDHIIDFVQCSHAECVRDGIKGLLVVYNTPYLAGEDIDVDYCEEEIAVIGGLAEAISGVSEADRIDPDNGCIILVFSSLSSEERNPLSVLEEVLSGEGFSILCVEKRHFFFEDIFGIIACKNSVLKGAGNPNLASQVTSSMHGVTRFARRSCSTPSTTPSASPPRHPHG